MDAAPCINGWFDLMDGMGGLMYRAPYSTYKTSQELRMLSSVTLNS